MSRYLHLRAASALLLLGVMSSVIAAFGLPMGGASAASAPRALAPSTSIFCGYASNAAKSTSISSAALTPTSIEASYAKLKTEESFIEANSPGQIKPDFVLLFGYLNKFISIMASVKYNYAKLTPTELKSFATADTKQVSAAEKAINSYLTNTCHIKTT